MSIERKLKKKYSSYDYDGCDELNEMCQDLRSAMYAYVLTTVMALKTTDGPNARWLNHPTTKLMEDLYYHIDKVSNFLLDQMEEDGWKGELDSYFYEIREDDYSLGWHLNLLLLVYCEYLRKKRRSELDN